MMFSVFQSGSLYCKLMPGSSSLLFAMLYHYSYAISLRSKGDPSISNESIRIKSPFTIPPTIHATSYFAKTCIAPLVARNMMIDVVDLDISDDVDNVEFLKQHFPPNVTDAYNRMKRGAHRADLYRYAKLYIDGGIYLDIETHMKQPPMDVFKSGTTDFTWYAALTVRCFTSPFRTRIYNGMIASPPRNPFFLRLIDYVVAHSPPANYFTYCNNFGDQLRDAIGADELHPGVYHLGDQTLVLLKQHATWGNTFSRDCKLSGFDREGLCSNVFGLENDHVASPHDPTYPKGASWAACMANAEKDLAEEASRYQQELVQEADNNFDYMCERISA